MKNAVDLIQIGQTVDERQVNYRGYVRTAGCIAPFHSNAGAGAAGLV